MDASVVRKFVKDSENFEIDSKVIEQSLGTLQAVTEGLLQLDQVLEIPSEVQPFPSILRPSKTGKDNA